ncbi:unnamed protein product [Ceratitis capitata]|uniref:(Mediterranean fruit fly) hypothetical protein n=1 Tax=Ceratitis capitata TaxID=7213 RepID=A0A811U865_CERCA|nr:unnamed protein product [Ceratitis capitata]
MAATRPAGRTPQSAEVRPSSSRIYFSKGTLLNVWILDTTTNIGSNDEKLLKELLEIWRNIKQLKKRDDELDIRQQELQLEHRHAQLKEELNLRLSFSKLDKSSADVAAEGAILNEMLEIVAKRAALRPTSSGTELSAAVHLMSSTSATAISADGVNLMGDCGPTIYNNDESNI